MATLQSEREMYAQMFGEEMIVQPDNQEEPTLNDFDEALFLYEDMLHDALLYGRGAAEINLLNREIAECKFQKRELVKKMKYNRRMAG